MREQGDHAGANQILEKERRFQVRYPAWWIGRVTAMINLATAEAPRDLWERTRFNSLSDRPLIDDSHHDVLAPLYLGYGPRAGGKSSKACLTCPSAGALYPLEIYCRLPGDDAISLYDPATGILRRRMSPPAGLKHLFAVYDHEGEATLALLLRPWVSIRKYGLRGYFYSHLDGAHALAGIVRAAEALSRPVGVWLPAEDRQQQEGREVYAVVSLACVGLTVPATLSPARDRVPPEEGGRESVEAMVWDRLRAFGAGAPWPCASGPATFALLAPGKAGSSVAAPWDPQTWTRRRSAHSFDESAAVSMSAVAQLLERMPQEFPGNLSPAAGRPYLRVVESAAQGRAGAVWEFDGSELRATAPCKMTGADFVSACAQQRLVEHASALVVFVAGRGQLRAMSEVMVALLCSGILSAQLYLGCAERGYGCTCIGAYDSAVFGRHGVIGDGEDVVNVVAVGMAGSEQVEKVDRTQFALRSGEATW